MKWTVRVVVLSGLLALVPATRVAAQYPINPAVPCVSSPSPVDLGTLSVGQAAGTVVCGPWQTPQNVAASINGANFTKPANADGSVSVTVAVNTPSSATVNPEVPILCGGQQNIITLSGTGVGGAAVVKQVIFRVNCNQFGGQFFPGNNFFPGSVFPGVGAFSVPGSPGLVIAPSQTSSQQEQQQQQSVSVPAGSSGGVPAAAAPAAATQGRVAFTGANVVRWSIAALALMGVGALLVLHSRRRRPLLGS